MFAVATGAVDTGFALTTVALVAVTVAFVDWLRGKT